MATDMRNGSETTSFAGLLSGILNDAQDLVKQEVTLAKVEVREELRKAKDAAIAMAVGVGALALGGIFLLLMVVYLIHWAASGNIPPWRCYAIVRGILASAGAILLYAGRNTAERVNFVPRQTVETLRENVQWIKNPR